MNLIDQLATRYYEKFGHKPAHIARAPGRVNLLGEHVDYNDGFVLPAAIDHSTYVAFSPWTLNLFPQNMKPAMLARAIQVILSSIALKTPVFNENFS